MRFCLVFTFTVSAFAGPSARILETAPIRFEPHSGAWVAKGLNHSITFTGRATTLRLGEHSVKMTLTGSSAHAKLAGSDPQVASNYFTGREYTSVPAFARLRRKSVYAGIDMVYYGTGGELEYDFEIAPGAKPSAIRMHFEGADHIAVNERNEIVLSLGESKILQRAPVVYQKLASGEIVSIPSRYRIDKHGDVRVELSGYDRSKPLVIDPVLNFSAFLFGSSTDIGIAVAHDPNGNVYIAGNTWSGDFPVTEP